MFCGLPILASKVSDNSIYLSNQSELLFKPEDPNEIADRLKYFSQLTLMDKTIIGENNYKSAKYFFDYTMMLDKYEKLFKND
jgi:glycosyltransferase involved in cell wall biosynthesis